MKCTKRLQLWPYNNINTKKKQILIASRKFDCHCWEYPPEFPTPRDQHQAEQKEFHKQRLSASPETISVCMSFCCSCKFCHCKEDESLQLWSHFHVNNQQQWFATNNTVEIDLVQILGKTFLPQLQRDWTILLIALLFWNPFKGTDYLNIPYFISQNNIYSSSFVQNMENFLNETTFQCIVANEIGHLRKRHFTIYSSQTDIQGTFISEVLWENTSQTLVTKHWKEST